MSKGRTRILLAEDSDDDAELVINQLRQHGYEPEGTRVMEAADFREALNGNDWDIILCDYVMPSFDALAALGILKQTGRDIPFIIVSGTIGEDVAVEALKHGASDYVLKQNLARLGSAVEHELRDAEDRKYRRLIEGFSEGQTEVLEMILEGRPASEILTHIATRIECLSPTDTLCSIMLVNEEGTHLVMGAAPNLPEEYIKAINPLPIQSDLGSCGPAAALGKAVIIEDITTHPNWERVHDLVIKYGLHACWALPIFSAKNELLGTMGIYHKRPRKPSPKELHWVEAAAKLVSVTLERSRSTLENRRISERLSTTLESITDAFYTLDQEWRFTYLNNEAERLLRHQREAILGKVVWEVFPEVVGTAFQKCFLLAAETQEKVSCEEYYAPLDSWFSMNAYPSSEGLAVYFQDCSARRQSEAHLRLLETCITHLNDIVIVTGAESINEEGPRILFVNEAFAKRTGYDRKEVIGRSIGFLQGPETDPKEIRRILIAMHQGRSIRSEIVNHTKAGEPFWLELEIVPITNQSGELSHWVAVGRDTSERKKAEESLSERTADLERFHRLSVGRELQMIALKKEVNALTQAQGKDPPYRLDFLSNSEPKENE